MPAKHFRFHPAAEAELIAAADWHEEQREGLGPDFIACIRAKIASIMEAPRRWRLVAGTRRVLVGRFPYAVVYREIGEDGIEIVAVAHFKRRPAYWSAR